MNKATALILFILSLMAGYFNFAYAGEIVNIRTSVLSDKTRVVFDLDEKTPYRVEITDPYQVILHFDGVNDANIKRVTGKLGKVIESVTPISETKGLAYVFNLKYSVSPTHAYLTPQGNYKNHRVYIDFGNNNITGPERSKDYVLKMPEIASSPKKQSIAKTNGVDVEDAKNIDSIKVLSPEEAEKRRLEIQKENAEHMAGYGNAHHEQKNTSGIKDSITDKKNAIGKNDPKADNKQLTGKNDPKADNKQLTGKNDPKADNKQLTGKNDPKVDNKQTTGKNDNKQQNDKKDSKQDVHIAQNKNDQINKQTTVTPTQSQKKEKKQDPVCTNGAFVVVAIDPGHGGKDPGAIGPGKTREKDVTLKIALQLYNKINKIKGMKAVLTRRKDVFINLDERSEIARRNNADILISIHADAAENSAAAGASVLVLNNDRAGRENKKMLNTKQKHDQLLGGASDVLEKTASIGENNSYMQNMIIDLTSDKSRDAGYDLANKIIYQLSKFAVMHKNKPDERSLAVLKAPDIPSILIETGFVSNPNEEKKLKNSVYQKEIAEAIATAIQAHLSNPKYKLSPERHCKKK